APGDRGRRPGRDLGDAAAADADVELAQVGRQGQAIRISVNRKRAQVLGRGGTDVPEVDAAGGPVRDVEHVGRLVDHQRVEGGLGRLYCRQGVVLYVDRAGGIAAGSREGTAADQSRHAAQDQQTPSAKPPATSLGQWAPA